MLNKITLCVEKTVQFCYSDMEKTRKENKIEIVMKKWKKQKSSRKREVYV